MASGLGVDPKWNELLETNSLEMPPVRGYGR